MTKLNKEWKRRKMRIVSIIVLWGFKEENSQHSLDYDLGPVSRKSRKLYGPAKPFVIICILKIKKCIGMKFCMKGNFVHIKNM